MTRRLSAAVFSTALLLACHGTPAPATPLSPFTPIQQAPPPPDVLRQRVDALLADPALALGTWSIDVRSLERHDTLVDVNAHRLLTPASTMKTITLAVAADRLGWDFTYQTRVFVAGTVAGGVLDGDLVIVGAGDPSLDDWDGQATALFKSWAEHLKDIGIETITGRIIGDDNAFSDEGYGPGWAWDDMAFSYSAPASALQFNEGTAQIVISPGPATKSAAEVTLAPSSAAADVQIDDHISTTVAGVPSSVTLIQHARSPVITLAGAVGFDGRQVRNVAVANPTLYFARAARAGLIANGIEVRGPAVDVDDLPGAPVTPGPPILEHRSPTLSSLADTMMKLSQNLYAESLLRTLGLTQAGVGTGEAGRTVVRDTLASWGVPAAESLVMDGSGLSRYNLVSAATLVSVLEHVYGDQNLRDAYMASLPVAGQAGTLAERMKETTASGNVRAKTGSFSNARSVAGFVQTADGEPLAFAVMANNFGIPAADVDRVTDEILVALSRFTRQ